MKQKSIKTAVAGSTVAPVAPVVALTIESAKAQFVSAFKGIGKAKTALTEAFNAAKTLIPDAKTLRDTLKAWAVSAGAEEKTASNVISGLFLSAGMALRKKTKGPGVTAEQTEAAQQLIETLTESCENAAEIITVLKAALALARAAKPAVVPVVAPVAKAA